MRPPLDSASTVTGRRIVAVEDDFVLLLEIATVLSNAGATVTKCPTIEQALQTIGTEPFDAAILDVRVGRETITPVARLLTERGTPFLFYTGQVPSEATIMQWPAVRIVSKPALPAVLIGALVELLGSAAKPNARGQ